MSADGRDVGGPSGGCCDGAPSCAPGSIQSVRLNDQDSNHPLRNQRAVYGADFVNGKDKKGGTAMGGCSTEIARQQQEMIRRLLAEVAALKAGRNAAQRRCCFALVGTGVWRQPRWTPQLIANELGWDCFKEEVRDD